MKFQKEITQKGALVPVFALEISHLTQPRLEMHTPEGAVVLLNAQMTAPELLAAAQALQDLSAQLLTHLANACGRCCGCEECPEHIDEDSPLNDLPDDLLDAFVESDICLDLLEKHLILEDIVYGD